MHAEVNGLRMYYEVHGAGRPLVLVHGGMQSIDLTWGATLEAFAATHQVIAVELQGHGHTVDIDRPMALEHLADDLATLLGQLGIAAADVFGFSLGGLVALELALRHPAVVRRLVLGSVHARPDGYHAEITDPTQWETSTRMPTEADFQAMRDAYLRTSPAPEQFEAVMAKTSAMVHALLGWTDDVLRSLAPPTLLVIGDHDFVRIEHAAELLDRIPNAQLAVLPATTHNALTQDAIRILAIVEPFLAAD